MCRDTLVTWNKQAMTPDDASRLRPQSSDRLPVWTDQLWCVQTEPQHDLIDMNCWAERRYHLQSAEFGLSLTSDLFGKQQHQPAGAGNRWCPLQHILGAFTPLPSFFFRLFPLTNFFSPAVWQIIHFSTGVLPLIPQTSTPSSRSDNCIVSVQSISGGFTHKLRQQGLYLLKTNTGLWYCAYCHLISRCSHPNKFSIWRLWANTASW